MVSWKGLGDIFVTSKVTRLTPRSRLQGTDIKAYMMEVNGYEHKFTPINVAARRNGKRKTKKRCIAAALWELAGLSLLWDIE
jgi:hypothetical protein